MSIVGRLTRTKAALAACAVAALGAAAACHDSASWSAGPVTQGWTEAYRAAWYNADQGSRLMPLTWMKALEQPDQTPAAGAAPAMFLDPVYLDTFRILPPYRERDLPVGFAIDRGDDSALQKTHLRWYGEQTDGGDWVGLNCAACHTAQMDYQGHTIRVDGGPSLFDFQGFIEKLDSALMQTRDSAAAGANPGRWNRFVAGVLGHSDTPQNRAMLLSALNQLIAWEQQTEALNKTDLRYGFGRVDAVGHIFNRILLFGGAPQPTPPNAADAPVSYPQLWNITKQYHLQWDGIATNNKIGIPPPAADSFWGRLLRNTPLSGLLQSTPFDYGAMGRNAGEVLGVFGDMMIKPPASKSDLSGFTSSVDAVNLNRIEVELTRLAPPVWPAALFGQPGAVDITGDDGKKLTPDQVVNAGAALFKTYHCDSCHTPHATYETMVSFTELQQGDNLTDIWMACNAWADRGASGLLTGIPDSYIAGVPTPASAPVSALLTTAVKGVMVSKKYDIARTALESIFGYNPPPTVFAAHAHALLSRKDQRRDDCMRSAATGNALMAYKARPLEGIWATAPYLHNGSAPTLYDLLLPPAQRPSTFKVGTRVYDPVKAGYSTDPNAPGNSFTFDTSLEGNANTGHDYGVGNLTDTQRRELLEYLKSL